jgi:hypothetical protein
VAIRLPSGDLYAELGVAPDATRDEISSAFRARARSLHPDANPDPVATAQFQRLTTAYRVLVDPEHRARYDAGRAPAAPTVVRPGVPSRPAEPAADRRASFRLTRRGARWLVAAGIVLLVLSIAVGTWVLLDPGTGGDRTGREVTLWIVAAKLLIGGVVALVLAARRLRWAH